MEKELEEAAENNSKKVGSYAGYQDFIAGAKWQAKRMYSEEEVCDILVKLTEYFLGHTKIMSLTEWFEQFKKK